MEKTFIMIKPDGVGRGLVGEIISRIEKKGLELVTARLMKPSVELIREHYKEHSEKSFYGELVDSIADRKVMALVIEGENSIRLMRIMIGDKDPLCASPGTIRGDLASETTRNLVHASDSEESAEREIKLWFGEIIG